MLITQGGLALRLKQNHVISKKNKSHVFHWKRSVVVLECCLQINLAAKTTWSKSLTCSTVILWYISSFECQGFKLCEGLRSRQIQKCFKLLCNRTWENGKLLGEEPRNMVQQLFERPKLNCLKFLADYTLTQQHRDWYEAPATGRHLQNRWKTDLAGRRVLRRRKSD